MFAVVRLHPHLTIESVQLWLPLAWAADVAAIVTSVAMASDRQRVRYGRPQRDDRAIRDQYRCDDRG